MGKKTKKSDNNESDGGDEEDCGIASQASNNSAHGEVGNPTLSLSDIQKLLTGMEERITDILQENKQLKLKVDDLENRSRRCNIRITGIPEQAEGARPTTFIESFLAEIFGPTRFLAP